MPLSSNRSTKRAAVFATDCLLLIRETPRAGIKFLPKTAHFSDRGCTIPSGRQISNAFLITAALTDECILRSSLNFDPATAGSQTNHNHAPKPN